MEFQFVAMITWPSQTVHFTVYDIGEGKYKLMRRSLLNPKQHTSTELIIWKERGKWITEKMNYNSDLLIIESVGEDIEQFLRQKK